MTARRRNRRKLPCANALKIYKDEGCDGIIAIGGGSPMDLAKAVAPDGDASGPVAAGLFSIEAKRRGQDHRGGGAHGGDPDHLGHRKRSEPRRPSSSWIPGRKLAIGSPYLIPRLALIDPELTMSLPPHLTAGTGMDALTHNIECYLANVFNPPADSIAALDGWRKPGSMSSVPRRTDRDREARYNNMAVAAMEGAMVFQKGHGAVHALSPSHRWPERLSPAPRDAERDLPAGGAALQRARGRRQIQARAQVMGLPRARPDAAAWPMRGALTSGWHPEGTGRAGLAQDTIEKSARARWANHCHLSTPRQPTKAQYID